MRNNKTCVPQCIRDHPLQIVSYLFILKRRINHSKCGWHCPYCLRDSSYQFCTPPQCSSWLTLTHESPSCLALRGRNLWGWFVFWIPCRVRLRLEFCLKLHLCLASCPFLSCSPLCGFLFIKLLHFFNSLLELCFRVGFWRICPKMIILRTHAFFYHFLFSDNFISALTVIIFFFLIDLGLYSSLFSPNFLSWRIRALISFIFLVYAFNDVYFPLNMALAVVHQLYVVIWFIFKIFSNLASDYLFDYLLVPLNLYIFGDFPDILNVIFYFNSVVEWKPLWMISILLNLWTFPDILENVCILMLYVECSI